MRMKVSLNSEQKVERRLNTVLLPVLAIALAILYALTNYRGWLIFFVGIAGAWLLAFVWVETLQRSIQIERKVHFAWATVGESVPEQLRLANHGWLPAIWLEIVDVSGNVEEPLRLVSDVGSHTTRTRYLNHLYKKRGLYTLGPTRLRTGDPFGIFTLTVFDQQASAILITPPLLPLTGLRISPGGWAGDQRRRRGIVEWEISDNGVRDYVPGDSLRRIHWSASAHSGSLIVRQLESATSGDWWIFLDLEDSVQDGSGLDSTLELSIVLAASLAVRGLRERRKVGLVLAGPNLVWLEPRADPAQRWRILRALAMAETGKNSLSDLLSLVRPTQAATTILITPSTETGWIAKARRSQSSANTSVFLLDPQEFGGWRDQSRMVSALSYHGLPYTRIPKALLSEAYASTRQGRRASPAEMEGGKRYMQQGKTTWASMD